MNDKSTCDSIKMKGTITKGTMNSDDGFRDGCWEEEDWGGGGEEGEGRKEVAKLAKGP